MMNQKFGKFVIRVVAVLFLVSILGNLNCLINADEMDNTVQGKVYTFDGVTDYTISSPNNPYQRTNSANTVGGGGDKG